MTLSTDNELTLIQAEDFGTDVPLPRQYAHFFSKTARKPAELVLTETPKLDAYAISIPVAGMRAARAEATRRNAIVWNF